MAFKNALENIEFWNKKEMLKQGDVLQGFYVDERKFKSPKFGDASMYIIEKDDKTRVGVIGQAILVRAFSCIPVGCYVKITFNGKISTKNGQQANDYEVMFDDEKRKTDLLDE